MPPSNSNDYLSQLLGISQALPSELNKTAQSIVSNIPTLSYTPPSGGDLMAKYNEFLQKAASDPNLVNYYQKLLDQSQGDYTTATQLLETDYQTGVRQAKDNLSATLKSFGIDPSSGKLLSTGTFPQEQRQLQDTLNQRGIALTQGDDGKLTYAGGGQPASELTQLNTDQQLRKEAQMRSAQQNIENLGISRTKGYVGAGQQLQSTAEQIAQNKQQDILNRANTSMGIYNAGQQADLMSKQLSQYGQSQNPSGGSSNPNIVGGKNYTGWDPVAAKADQKALGFI